MLRRVNVSLARQLPLLQRTRATTPRAGPQEEKAEDVVGGTVSLDRATSNPPHEPPLLHASSLIQATPRSLAQCMAKRRSLVSAVHQHRVHKRSQSANPKDLHEAVGGALDPEEVTEVSKQARQHELVALLLHGKVTPSAVLRFLDTFQNGCVGQ